MSIRLSQGFLRLTGQRLHVCESSFLGVREI